MARRPMSRGQKVLVAIVLAAVLAFAVGSFVAELTIQRQIEECFVWTAEPDEPKACPQSRM